MGGKTVGKYDLYHTLGEGAYAKVKFAVNRETKENVAIKILDKEKIQQQNMGAQLKKEIGIMKMVHHEHLVVVKDVFATQKKIFLVLELVEGGELFDKIANEGKLSEARARFYFKQLVSGLLYCHGLGICHRDLKPENLLLDAKGNLKISDFGVSTLTVGDADAEGDQRAELLRTTCGTPNYVAPEVLANKGYDGKKADVWSCGVILYVLVAGYLPFEEATMVALFKKIKHADFTYPSWFSSDIKQLISKILIPDPEVRLSLAEISHHPWLQKEVDVPPPCVTPAARMQPKDIRHASESIDSDEDINTSKAKVPNPRGKKPIDKLTVNTSSSSSREGSPDKPVANKRPSTAAVAAAHVPAQKVSSVKTRTVPPALDVTDGAQPEETAVDSSADDAAALPPSLRKRGSNVSKSNSKPGSPTLSPQDSSSDQMYPPPPPPPAVPSPVPHMPPVPVTSPSPPSPPLVVPVSRRISPRASPSAIPSPVPLAAPAPIESVDVHAPTPVAPAAGLPSLTPLTIPVTHHVHHHQHTSPSSSAVVPSPMPMPAPQPDPSSHSTQNPQFFGEPPQQQQQQQQYPNQQQYNQTNFQGPNNSSQQPYSNSQQHYGSMQYGNQQYGNQQLLQYPSQQMLQQRPQNGISPPYQQLSDDDGDDSHHPFAGGCPCNLFEMLFGGNSSAVSSSTHQRQNQNYGGVHSQHCSKNASPSYGPALAPDMGQHLQGPGQGQGHHYYYQQHSQGQNQYYQQGLPLMQQYSPQPEGQVYGYQGQGQGHDLQQQYYQQQPLGQPNHQFYQQQPQGQQNY